MRASIGIPATLISALLLAAPCAHAGTATLTVSASILSNSNCRFFSPPAALSFGNLDPGNPVDVTVSTTIRFRCMGSAPIATFLITDDDGLHETAPDANRMQHAALPGAFLPYGLTLAPESATVPKNAPQILTVTGTVRGVDYLNAFAGIYADTVVITLEP